MEIKGRLIGQYFDYPASRRPVRLVEIFAILALTDFCYFFVAFDFLS